MSDLIGEAWTHTGYAQRLHFGAGVVARLPEIVKDLGIRRALFVTTEGRAESEDGAAHHEAAGTLDRLEVHRGALARADDPRASGDATGASRRSRRRRLVRRRVVC